MGSASVSLSFAILLCNLAAYAQHPAPVHPLPSSTAAPAAVGGISPFPSGCNGNQSPSVNYSNAPVEPYVAVDPGNPQHLVGVWQQDRWSDGGSSGLVAATSMDGGKTWANSLAQFSRCSGGAYERASDPWVAISPDGTAYFIALGLNGVSNGSAATTAVLVSRSANGGYTWDAPTTVILHNNGGDDKEAITADPNDAHYVYAVWDRPASGGISVWFSRTADGGATWDAARVILSPANAFATANQLVVLPDGSVVDIFVWTMEQNMNSVSYVAATRSTDHGLTWSTPVFASTNQTIGTVNANTQTGLRTGAGIPSASVDRSSGAIYVVWSDARFSGGQRDGVALSKSVDGGLTWSKPVQVNQAPNVQAFTPAVAVAADGSIGVTYFDFRQDTGAVDTLLANYWRVVSKDGGATWQETAVGGPFDILSAPRAEGAPFLGDYQGLTASGDQFLSFFVAANSGNTANPTSVFADFTGRPASGRSTLRTEVNLHPRPYRPDDGPKPKK